MNDLENRRFKAEEIGRNDKNGHPIKEGDIISIDGNPDWGGIVTYNKETCAFGFEHGGSFAHGWGEAQESDPEQDWEITGSIYNKL